MTVITHRDRRKQDLRNQILETAREIFMRDGFEDFSMRKLAAQIGYSAGNLYLYFENKEQLFDRLVEQSFERLLAALQELRDDPGQDDPVRLLLQGLKVYVDFGLRSPNDYRFAFMLRPPRKCQAYEPHAAFNVLRSMVKRCVEHKRFRKEDVELASQSLWMAAHGVTSLLIQRPSFPWVDKNKLVDQVLRNAVQGFVRSDPDRNGKGGNHGNHGIG